MAYRDPRGSDGKGKFPYVRDYIDQSDLPFLILVRFLYWTGLLEQ